MTNAGTYSLEDGNPLNSVEYACLPGSPQELERFKKLQLAFGREFADVFPGHHSQKAVVIVPSLTLDQEILAKIKGQVFYEERMLCLLMLLRMPNTHVIFVTSVPVDPVIIDYYLHLLPGITGFHARPRLTLLSCYDAEPLSLTQKILERPRLIKRIRTAIPAGYKVEVIATHDQSRGGESGQVFLGADFPASEAYSREIGIMGRRVAEALKEKGVLGRFSIDFLTLREQYAWKHFALEINLRKGGTTHPYLMLQFLTNGEYDQGSGIYTTVNGQPRCYYATDDLHNEKYSGLTPQDLLEISIGNELHYDATLQEGVVFHLISALSQYGKLGLLCIGKTPEKTRNIYNKTVEVLNNL